MINQDVETTMNSLGIRGDSPLLKKAINDAIQVAPFDVSVLITGENGVGKDVFYKILHNGSRRRHQKCIAVNCGGLPEGTIDSELFGHVKGAYTGALGDRKGFFEEADGGTIFLDEVGDLPMTIQAKLLRVLEKGEIIRMGSNDVKTVDVRIVAATNVDLPKAIREGKFREDLYYRLSTIIINVPSLRERGNDIDLLFRYFASETARKYHMTSGIRLTPDAKQLILAYQWPGNVRQLLHVVEEISIIEEERMIDAATLQRYLPKFTSGVSVGGNDKAEGSFEPGEKAMLYQVITQMRQELNEVRERLGIHTSGAPRAPHALISGSSCPIVTPAKQEEDKTPEEKFEEYEEAVEVEDGETHRTTTYTSSAPISGPRTLDDIEKQAIAEALRRNGGNKRKAADELGISERTIHRKIQEYGLQTD